jgi:DNA modification methylase
MKINCSYTKLVPISELKPNPKNRNFHPEKQIKVLARIIEKNGQRSPVVVSNRSGYIIKGHARLEALKLLNVPECAVDYQDYETEADEYRDMIADNEISRYAEFDTTQFLNDIKDLPNVDFEDFGLLDFKVPEVIPDGNTDPDAVPEVKETRAKLGDVWQLGEHRVMCGSATDFGDVEKLMNGELADLVVTDPPYNIDYEGKTKNKLKIMNDKMDNFYQFLLDFYTNACTFVRLGGGIYVFHADMEGINFRQALLDGGFKLSECCIWVKQTIVMGRNDYHWKHEPILYGWKEGAAHSWYSDRKQSTVWNFDRPSRSEDHPTMKPIELIKYPIGNSSKQGDIVMDLFGGSGTTLMACEVLGRKCRMMELDPHYVDVILKRWEDYTGKEAKLLNTDGIKL